MKVAHSIAQDHETELVERLRSGDRTAVEEFYNTYRDSLYFLVFKQVGRDRAAAEDIVQETFLAALDSLDRFHGDSQLYTWLSSIAYYKIKDSYRRRAREVKSGEASLDIDVMRVGAIEDAESMVSHIMESEETCQSVQRVLDSLPPDYQKVLMFKYSEGMPVLQISQLMARSPKSVEGLLSRARKALRHNLGKADASS